MVAQEDGRGNKSPVNEEQPVLVHVNGAAAEEKEDIRVIIDELPVAPDHEQQVLGYRLSRCQGDNCPHPRPRERRRQRRRRRAKGRFCCTRTGPTRPIAIPTPDLGALDQHLKAFTK
ncbi:unnamed protein product [Urochloa humidicola]